MKIIYLGIGIALIIGLIIYLVSVRRNNTESNDEINEQVEVPKAMDARENPYNGLRKMALDTTPEQLGITLPTDKTVVYGVVMDWAAEQGIATFAIFQTGDASMYTSTGGGVIGGGQHENVRKAASAFVTKAQSYIGNAVKTKTTPLPEKNTVIFYFVTNKGTFTAQDHMSNFENETSEWMELFEDANKVITELRQTSQ